MNRQDEKLSSTVKSFREVGPYLGLGSQLAATIILMFFLGHWLDSEFGTEPILTIVFAFIGGTVGVYNFIKTVLELNKKNKVDED